ncbi:MAG: plasmid replication protein RepC [Mangrovicoccus sp.]|nr:plasmid replication protein RepC [Mangrovicoccus sp.]
MERLSSTPFGRRAVTAAQISGIAVAQAAMPGISIDKWRLFRALTTARAHYALSSRALTVLNALLSFHPETDLSGDAPIIVFPSNRVLGERAHGMSEATLRRHLATLVEAGFIARHDSPNGKRYRIRNRDGAVHLAFGFDLRPMLVRAAEIFDTEAACLAQAEALKSARTKLVLLIRDATKLIEFGQAEHPTRDWATAFEALAELRRAIRRKLGLEQISELISAANTLLTAVKTQLAETDLPQPETEKLSGCDTENERHYQNSNTNTLDKKDRSKPVLRMRERQTDPTLAHMLRACPSLQNFSHEELKDWPSVQRSANTIRPWLGINIAQWQETVSVMGPSSAAICLAGILERQSEIRSPGAYLRHLTEKARAKKFTTGPMINALLNRTDRGAQPC